MSEKLFPSQQPDEKILIVVREHWFRLFIKVAVVALLLLLPAILRALLGDDLPLLDTERGAAIIALVLRFYYLGLLLALFVVWILYYLNLHIVSEERIVDIDQTGLLNHIVSELNIETIEDVSSQTTGLFGNLLNYGTVFIQTAGATERFQFEKVPNPARIASVILELYEQQTTREKPKPWIPSYNFACKLRCAKKKARWYLTAKLF